MERRVSDVVTKPWWELLHDQALLNREEIDHWLKNREESPLHISKMNCSEESIKLTQARALGLPVFDHLPDIELDSSWYQKISYSFVKKYRVLPIREEKDGKMITLVNDPFLLYPLADLRAKLDRDIIPAYIEENLLFSAIDLCYNQKKEETAQLILEIKGRLKADDASSTQAVDGVNLLEDEKEDAPIVKLINLILIEAIQNKASDIHLEPCKAGLNIRYRIDGMLQSLRSPIRENQKQLISRIKVMAKLDIAEQRLPQDGRIQLRMGEKEVDLRISTIPISYGERIVIRILDQNNVSFGLDQLLLPENEEKQFKEWISHSEGIVLVTGPTGSGKTTTLYSVLRDINATETNIMTIEDPVEYQLPGIAQIGVKPKIQLTFASGLRHILRQDPDVIMIGEIRDEETASIAVQAALTGHLVLSTLHTNDAPSTVTRLVDMGIEPYLLAPSLIGVIAQRLVRKLCPHCKESYSMTKELLDKYHLTEESVALNTVCFRPKGCEKCNQIGYQGRRAIYELMEMSPAIKRKIVQKTDVLDLRQTALSEGMIRLKHQGIQLVIYGETSFEEVLRVANS